MLDIKFICSNLDLVKKNIESRGKSSAALDQVCQLNSQRKKIIQEVENLKAQKNRVSAEIAQLKKERKEAEKKISEMQKVALQINELDTTLAQINSQIEKGLLSLPNLLHQSVPRGKDENDNVEVKKWGEGRKFKFPARQHFEIAEQLDILDFPRAAKLAGARFALYKGLGARLERALINFMLDIQTKEHGYTEFFPPLVVGRDNMIGTGQFPHLEDDAFKVENWDGYLVPTAEVPLVNIHREEIFSYSDLPLCYTAYTPCFRKEAGSYGKDVRGLIRQHQFNKVELVKFSIPESSYEELERLVENAETILQRLEIPYRVMALCSGDTGAASAKSYDIEVWLPGQNKYREISSCSNCEAYQARRANIRYRDKDGQVNFVHTLNGSGLAVGRTWVAVVENYQREDGSVEIPEALRPYMGVKEIK